MNANQDDSDKQADEIPQDLPANPTGGVPPSELDSAIIAETFQGAPQADTLARVQVGAEVYASDGADVAIVEIVSPGHLGIRAGQPGRSIELPAEAIARVSPDGLRVDITLSSAQIEQFSGPDSTGADHLAGLLNGQTDTQAGDEE